MKKKTIFIIFGVICIGIVTFHFLLITIFKIPKAASAYDKYENLLQVIKYPEDRIEYSDYKDLGLIHENFKLTKRIMGGYWVYMYPNWYIWKNVNLKINTEIVTEELHVVNEFKEKIYPEIEREIDAAAGFDVTIDVKWDTLAVPGWAYLLVEALPKVYFTPLTEALKAVTADEKAKEILQKILIKIIITNENEKYSTSGFTFENGILTIDHMPHTNIDYGYERKDCIQELLENAIYKYSLSSPMY